MTPILEKTIYNLIKINSIRRKIIKRSINSIYMTAMPNKKMKMKMNLRMKMDLWIMMKIMMILMNNILKSYKNTLIRREIILKQEVLLQVVILKKEQVVFHFMTSLLNRKDKSFKNSLMNRLSNSIAKLVKLNLKMKEWREWGASMKIYWNLLTKKRSSLPSKRNWKFKNWKSGRRKRRRKFKMKRELLTDNKKYFVFH